MVGYTQNPLIDIFHTYAIIVKNVPMDEFIYEVEVDICARTFKLKSDKGENKIVACVNTDEFMRVLEVCDQMLEPCMIVYKELALTTDK